MKMQINGKIVHKGYECLWRSGDLAPGLLNFSTRSRCVWLCNLDVLPVGKSPRCPFSRGLGESHNWCGQFGETPTAPAGNRTRFPLLYGCNLVTALITVPPLVAREKAIDLKVLTLLIGKINDR
jgi:hypothetical protein